MLDNGPIVKQVKPGAKIKIKEHLHGEEDDKYSTYKVIKVYPHMVLAEKNNGTRRCFSYGDLVIAGLEMQSVEYEEPKNLTQNNKGGRGPRYRYSRKQNSATA